MIALAVAALGVPAQAQARDATGLYSPFPSLVSPGHLRGYVADLGVSAPASELERGVAIGSVLRAPAQGDGAALSARIHPEDGAWSGLLAVAAAIVAVCAAPAAWRLRRNP